MAWLDLFRRDLEHSKPLTCPHCTFVRVSRRSTWRSSLLIGGLALPFWIGVFAPQLLVSVAAGPVLFLAVWFAALFLLAASVAAALSAVFGHNRCLACRHRWR